MRITSSPLPTSFSGAEVTSRLRDSRWWWYLAGAAVLVLLAVTIYVAQSAWAPRTPWDENGIFELARVIAGQDDVPLMMTRGYYPATSFLIAPLYWFTSDPLLVYGWGNVITNAVGLATIFPLIGIAKRVGLNLPQAITASAIALLMPGHTGLADYVLSEQPLQLFVAMAAYGAMRFWEEPRTRTGALLIVSSLLALFTHPRAIAVVAVAAIWLVGLIFDRDRRRKAIIALAALLPAAYVTKVVADNLATLVLVGSFGQGKGLFTVLLDPDWFLIAKVTTMQTWAQMVGTLGMISIGLVVLALWAFREIFTSRIFGPAVFFLGLTLAGAFTSFLSWSGSREQLNQGNPRLDAWVYTRYIDPFITVAVVVAIAALLIRLSWPVLLASLALTFGTMVTAVYGFADTIPTWGSADGPGNVAALRGWRWLWPGPTPHEVPMTPTFTSANRFWLIASVFTFLVHAAIITVSRFPRLMAGCLIVGYGAYCAVSNPELRRETPYRIEQGIDNVESVLDGQQVSMDFDIECGTNLATRETTINWLGFWFAPRDVDVVYPSTEEFDADVIIACAEWDEAESLGALPVSDSNNYGYQIWVPEGQLQDELIDAGFIAGP